LIDLFFNFTSVLSAAKVTRKEQKLQLDNFDQLKFSLFD